VKVSEGPLTIKFLLTVKFVQCRLMIGYRSYYDNSEGLLLAHYLVNQAK